MPIKKKRKFMRKFWCGGNDFETASESCLLCFRVGREEGWVQWAAGSVTLL